MSSTVKDLKVTCDPPKGKDSFAVGDWVTGVVTLEVVKECDIEALSIKFKGKAEVMWTERHGNVTVVYHDKDKYFSYTHYFVRDNDSGGNDDDGEALLWNRNGETYSKIVQAGCHTYPFTFQFPVMDMPSSFKGYAGKVVYMLQAKLSRSMRIPVKDTTKLSFASKPEGFGTELMVPQHEHKDKKKMYFTQGTVAMDVDLEKTGFYLGEGIKVLAHIENNSTREIKPKYCLYRKHSFFASGRRKVSTKDLLKEVGDPIPPKTNQMVTRVITIPPDMEPSIHNCKIIKAEHRLRVYLDIKYATDPQIKFPIIIMRLTQESGVAPPPATSDFGFGSLNISGGNPGASAWSFGPPQPPLAAASSFSEPPPSYEASVMYPPLIDFDNK